MKAIGSICPTVGNFFPCCGFFFALPFSLWVRVGSFPTGVPFLFLAILSAFCLLCCGLFSGPLFLLIYHTSFYSFTLSLSSTTFVSNFSLWCHIDGRIVASISESSCEGELLISASSNSCIGSFLSHLASQCTFLFWDPGILSTFGRLGISHGRALQEC